MASETGRTHNPGEDILRQWKYFLFAAVFAVFTSGVVLSDSFRSYEADTTILVIANVGTDAVGNIEVLSETDAFRSKFVSEVQNENEHFSAIGKEDLRDILRVKRDERGSVVHVLVSASDPDIAKDLSRKASLALFRVVGKYYDVHDIDFRIIDGPGVESSISSLFLYAISSVTLGISVTAAFFLLLLFLPNLIPFILDRKMPSDESRILDRSVFEPIKTDSPFLASEKLDREEAASGLEERSSTQNAIPVTEERKTNVPMNLPSFSEAEDRFLKEFSFEGNETIATSETPEPTEKAAVILPTAEESVPEEIDTSEPTEEEYRKRLNQLLRN